MTAWHILSAKQDVTMPTGTQVRLNCFVTAYCVRESLSPVVFNVRITGCHAVTKSQIECYICTESLSSCCVFLFSENLKLISRIFRAVAILTSPPRAAKMAIPTNSSKKWGKSKPLAVFSTAFAIVHKRIFSDSQSTHRVSVIKTKFHIVQSKYPQFTPRIHRFVNTKFVQNTSCWFFSNNQVVQSRCVLHVSVIITKYTNSLNTNKTKTSWTYSKMNTQKTITNLAVSVFMKSE